MARLVLIPALVYGAIVLLNPWAIHIGDRWTPLQIWTGTGKFVTASGAYPLMVTLSPSPHSSRLRLDGLRPTSGLSGWGWLCTPQGTTVRLRVSGTLYGVWRSTDGALLEFRMIERMKNFPSIQDGGYVDLFGYWRGPQLVMDDRGEWSKTVSIRTENRARVPDPAIGEQVRIRCRLRSNEQFRAVAVSLSRGPLWGAS